MRRAFLVVFALLVAGAAAAWWWTLPPRASEDELRRALELAPSSADGAVAIGAPSRAARWLARRPQALVLALAAAGEGAPAFSRLRPVVAPLAAAARGPMVVWWKGPDLGIASRVSPGSRKALSELGTLHGLTVVGGAEWIELATSTDLLASGSPTEAPAWGGPPVTALARVREQWWRVQASRSTLDAFTREAQPIPTAKGVSTVFLADAGTVLGWLGIGGVTVGPARVVVDDRHDWGIALPGLRLEGVARRLLGGGNERAQAGATWRGLLGEVWVVEGEGTSVASAPSILSQLPGASTAGQEGVVYGRHAAWLLTRAAAALERVPGLAAKGRSLAAASLLAEGLDSARFRLDEAGGRILLAW